MDGPGATTYLLANLSRTLIYQKQSSTSMAVALGHLFDRVTTTEQKQAAALGYSPLPANAVRLAHQTLLNCRRRAEHRSSRAEPCSTGGENVGLCVGVGVGVGVTVRGTLVVMFAGLSSEPGRTPVVAFVPDLMDRSRVEIAGREAGIPVEFVSHPDDLAGAVDRGARLVVIDLAHAGVLDVLPRLAPARTIGFASHVDKELFEAAKRAGCHEVLARSAVFRRLARAGDAG
ncbi:MAG TPA: hypothetical protein VNC61_06185 [Acidimicrobiales bacterium]|nr:hypothetical protein [Acidimicrobiales bacterium]